MAALTIQTYCIVWWLRYVCGKYASHNFLPGAPGAWMNHHVTTGLPNSKQCITAALRQGYSTSPNPISNWGLGRKTSPLTPPPQGDGTLAVGPDPSAPITWSLCGCQVWQTDPAQKYPAPLRIRRSILFYNNN